MTYRIAHIREWIFQLQFMLTEAVRIEFNKWLLFSISSTSSVILLSPNVCSLLRMCLSTLHSLRYFFFFQWPSIWGHLAHEEPCIPVQFVLVHAIMCCSFSVIQGARVEISLDGIIYLYHWRMRIDYPVPRYVLSRVSDRRRVLDWQLDLLHLTINYNWVSPDSLSLTTHDWIYHNNTAAIVTSATLVTGELQVPFLFPWIRTQN
jgi:hypothetical protein